jgi:hypothetical protein
MCYNKVWIMKTGPLFILLWNLYSIVLKTKTIMIMKLKQEIHKLLTLHKQNKYEYIYTSRAEHGYVLYL